MANIFAVMMIALIYSIPHLLQMKQYGMEENLSWNPKNLKKCEDVEPFKKVGNDLIKYFFHEHHLKLDKYDGVRDADKQCQACTLHIDSRDFYNCVKCDFYLHEVCANLPRKMDHSLHNHPLVLDPEPLLEYSVTTCFVFHRNCSGFMYKCTKTGCDDLDGFNPRKFQVDFGCILVHDYFTHKIHEHPLFIPIPAHEQNVWCKGCKGFCAGSYLKCTICSFTVCYKCATIPYKLHYKYDANLLLTLCYGEISNETYWCEVCEEKLDPNEWFYTCDKLYTIHRKCAFGSSGYMKPGYTFYYESSTVGVICNNSNTRPICLVCRQRCSSSVYFKSTDERCI